MSKSALRHQRRLPTRATIRQSIRGRELAIEGNAYLRAGVVR